MDQIRKHSLIGSAVGMLLLGMLAWSPRLQADPLKSEGFVVVEVRNPNDKSVELFVRSAPTDTPEIMKQWLKDQANEKVLRSFTSRLDAEEFLRSQTLHAVVEVEKKGSLRHIVREENADALRTPREGKKGRERIVAMFRESAEARAHARKMDREKKAQDDKEPAEKSMEPDKNGK